MPNQKAISDDIIKCDLETGHAQAPNSHFCRCTHVMYDSEKPDAVRMPASDSMTAAERYSRSAGIFLTVAKLRYLLYEAIVELQYVQDAEDHSLCASSKGKQIIKQGMELLEVKDLSLEHL